ncbi:MAG TPA: MarR family transcriptional regulator [Actinomycetota bacterium]|nr:MarR family transcriptional regulator [Actinomycetota bacterium]
MEGSSPGLSAERFHAWLNLLQTYSVVSGRIEAELDAAHGLSLAEHEVLIRLAQAEGTRLRMYDLADLLLLSKSGATRVVDRLEKRGLVERVVSTDDRRVVYAALTRSGAALLVKTRPLLHDSVERFFSGHLSDDEVARLRAVLRRVLEGNDAWAEHRCAPALEGAAPQSARRSG